MMHPGSGLSVTGQLDQQCQPASEQYNIQTEAYHTTLLDPVLKQAKNSTN